MIHICYSGSLDGFNPNYKFGKKSFFKKCFWTFKNNNIDSSTRSGYYFIKSIAKLNEKGLISPKKIQIEWWGKIDSLNQKQIDNEKLNDYFVINKYISKQDSLNKLKNADLLFLPLEKSNSPEHKTLFIPGKLFEYLETKKPILALCEDSDCKEILIKSGLGICVEPDNIEKISNTILKIINDVDFLTEIKPNIDFIENYSFKVKTNELVEIFNELENKNER